MRASASNSVGNSVLVGVAESFNFFGEGPPSSCFNVTFVEVFAMIRNGNGRSPRRCGERAEVVGTRRREVRKERGLGPLAGMQTHPPGPLATLVGQLGALLHDDLRITQRNMHTTEKTHTRNPTPPPPYTTPIIACTIWAMSDRTTSSRTRRYLHSCMARYSRPLAARTPTPSCSP